MHPYDDTRMGLEPVGGHDAKPTLYGIYFIGIALPVLLVDGWIAYGLWKSSRNHD